MMARKYNCVLGLLGYFLIGIILSGEAARFFYGHEENGQSSLWQPYSTEYLLVAFLLGFWFTLSTILLEIGFLFHSNIVIAGAFCGLTIAVVMMIFVGFPQRCQYQEALNNPFSLVLIAESLVLLGLGVQSQFVYTSQPRGS